MLPQSGTSATGHLCLMPDRQRSGSLHGTLDAARNVPHGKRERHRAMQRTAADARTACHTRDGQRDRPASGKHHHGLATMRDAHILLRALPVATAHRGLGRPAATLPPSLPAKRAPPPLCPLFPGGRTLPTYRRRPGSCHIHAHRGGRESGARLQPPAGSHHHRTAAHRIHLSGPPGAHQAPPAALPPRTSLRRPGRHAAPPAAHGAQLHQHPIPWRAGQRYPSDGRARDALSRFPPFADALGGGGRTAPPHSAQQHDPAAHPRSVWPHYAPPSHLYLRLLFLSAHSAKPGDHLCVQSDSLGHQAP